MLLVLFLIIAFTLIRLRINDSDIDTFKILLGLLSFALWLYIRLG